MVLVWCKDRSPGKTNDQYPIINTVNAISPSQDQYLILLQQKKNQYLMILQQKKSIPNDTAAETKSIPNTAVLELVNRYDTILMRKV